jgi:hypothetical protein
MLTFSLNIGNNLSDRVADWEAIIHKTVRSSDGNLVGNVDAVDNTSVFVSTEGGRTHYKLPKDVVEGYDGHQVGLTIPKSDLQKFEGGTAEGFKEIK